MKKIIHSLGCKTALLCFVFSLLTLHAQNTSSVTQLNTVLSSSTTTLTNKANPVSSKDGNLKGGKKTDTSKNPLLKDNSVLKAATNAFKSIKNSTLEHSTEADSNNAGNLGIRSSNLQNSGISEVAEKNSSSESSVSPFEAMKGKAEDLSKRDAFSKQFKNTDGSYTAVIGSSPIHYQKDGKFLDINPTIVGNIDKDYPFANKTNLFESYFGANATQGIKTKTSKGEVTEFLNTKMYWEVNGMAAGTISSSNPNLSVNANEASYKNLYGTISAEFLIGTGERKLNYIIPDKKALGIVPNDANFLVFEEQIILPSGWTHSNSVKGIVIKNERSDEVFTYTNPYSTDASLELSRDKNTVFWATQIGQTLTIKTKVKTDWLLNSERQFPIKVDPTLNYLATASVSVYSDGFLENNGYFGLIGGYFLQYHIKFNTSSIPIGSTFTSVVGSIVQYGMAGTRNAGSQWSWANSADPATTTGLALYNSVTTLESAAVNTQAANGTKSSTFTAAGLAYAVNSNNNLGYIAAAVYPTGTYNNNNYYAVYTHTDAAANRPYLTINYTAPSCFVPTNLNVDTITSTSARFTWNAASPAPAQGYDYYYNTTGLAPTGVPSGTVGAGVLTRTQTGLTPNTVYHFWIRSKCNSTTNVSPWIYGGYFNTNPAQNCFQGDGQVRGAVEDGLGVQMIGVYRVADDFIVPAGQAFTLSHISLEGMSTTAITNVTINIRANNNGSPGAILNTVWNNAAPTTSAQYATAFGFNVYHLNFTLPSTYNYPPGIYWVEVTMRNSNNSVVYWRATTGGSTGAVSQNSGDSGFSWVPNVDGYDMEFYVAGTCITCNPVTADSKIICAGDTVTLNVNSPVSGYTYDWYINWNEATQTGVLIGTGASINVTPSQSTVYRLVGQSSTCSGYTLVTVAISPGPNVVVATPISAITCSSEVAKLDVSGGVIPTTIFSEDFTPLKHSWTTSTTTTGGAGPLYAAWALYTNGTNSYAMADSDAYGPYPIETSLISEPMSFQDYSTVTLEFDHFFRQYLSASTGFVEISKDGGLTWSNVATYNSTRGTSFTNWQTESYNLNAYAGQGFVQIRFRYVANNAWYWAVNAVRINGTPLATTIKWLPVTGLWRDAAKTITYDGNHATTLYASPASTTTYTISAKTSVGCASRVDVTVERGDKDWNGSNQNWNVANNWSGSTVPTASHCVVIPSTAQKPIISVGTDAFAKNLTIKSGAGLTIDGNLTVTDFIKNENATPANVVIASDANLKQINNNPSPANAGSVTAKRDIKLSGGRQQYNYVISPLENQSLASIYKDSSGNPVAVPFVLYHNETNNRFYNSTGAYVKGRGLAVKEPATGFIPNTMAAVFAGPTTNGAFTYGIVNTELPDVNNGFNLTGNPYPSNIDLRKLYDINGGKTDPTQVISPNISATFYFWDNNGNTIFEQQGTNYSGQSYAIFNVLSGSNGTGTKANSGTKVPTKIVKVGQGFMTKSLISSYNLNFNNSIRTTETSTIDFLGKGNYAVQDDRYWLKMTAPTGIVSTIAVVYYADGNNLFGPEDSRTLGGSDEVYSMVDNEKVGINGRSSFADTDKIPLGSKHFDMGNYTFALDGQEGLFASGQNIYLKDKQSGTITNLRQGSYTFAANAGETVGRFEIIYKPESVLVTDSAIQENLVIYREGQDFIIQSTAKKIDEVEVYDPSGRLIYTLRPHAAKVYLQSDYLTRGVYLLKIKQGDLVTTKKIIK